MEVNSDNSIHSANNSGILSNLGSKIKVSKGGNIASPKANFQSKKNDKCSATPLAFETQVYLRALSRGPIHLPNVPINVLASQGFIAECLQECPTELISLMNSWNRKQLSIFFDYHDSLPEAMLGERFSSGVDSNFIPKILSYPLYFYA
jgi:hypothetical protein